MKVLSQARRICGYQLRILRGNYKLYLIPVCLFVYMLNELIQIRDFLFSVNEKASPFLLPFIFNDVMLTASIFVAAMLFFIDAPFYDKYQLFVIMRGGTSEWVLGHIMYIFSVSILYMLCLTGISILIIFPNVCLSGEWGRIWTTLALTDAGEQFGLSFGVSGYLIFEYRPLEAMFLVGGLGFFICSFYGLCLWCLNLCVGKIISFVTVSASIILVTRIKYLPEWIMYLTPSAWMDLNNLSKYARYEIDVVRAFIILVLGCLCLSGIAYYVTVHSDISG